MRPGTLFSRLLALFIIVPVVELVLLVWLGGQIGFWPTVLIIVLTAVVGSWLAQREGLSAWRRVQQRLSAGQLPGTELIDGLIILLAGALLLTPGVLTDIVGLAGLFPPSRTLFRGALSRRLKAGVERGTVRMYGFGPGVAEEPPPPQPGKATSRPPEPDEDVIDVEFEEYVRREDDTSAPR